MVEVIVSSAIFALAVAGLMSTISTLTQTADDSADEVAAAYVAKRIMDDLRKQVDATTWNESGSALSTGTTHSLVLTVGGVKYTASYQMTDDPDTDGRIMDMTIKW